MGDTDLSRGQKNTEHVSEIIIEIKSFLIFLTNEPNTNWLNFWQEQLLV